MNTFAWILTAGLLVYVVLRAFKASTKHSAVQNAFLAKYTYQRLPEAQKQIVMERTLEIMRRGGLLDEDLDYMCEILRFSFIALALSELGIEPLLGNERWHYVRNPYAALRNSDHQVEVVRAALQRKYNVTIEMDRFRDLAEMSKDKQRAR